MVVLIQEKTASYLQRRLSIGYARAARLQIFLKAVLLGPSNGAKPREIMVTKEQYASMVQDSIAGVRLHDQATATPPDNYLGDDNISSEEASNDASR